METKQCTNFKYEHLSQSQTIKVLMVRALSAIGQTLWLHADYRVSGPPRGGGNRGYFPRPLPMRLFNIFMIFIFMGASVSLSYAFPALSGLNE